MADHYEEGRTTTVTTTTTTTSSTEVITIGCNIGFLKSVIGILMLIEVILGLVCWALIVAHGSWGAIGFASFCAVSTWLAIL